MGEKISIIIVNWNGKDYLQNCLSSAVLQDYDNFKTIFIDNGSTDGSVEFVRNCFPGVEIIAFDSNYQFARANNIGIKRALEGKARFIALLNNDTKVEKNWLSELVAVMETDPRVGMCAPKMLKMNNPKILDSTGHIFTSGIIRDRGYGELDRGQYDKHLNVVGACAGACLYRREMLEEIGLFDESYGFGCEDVELSWRAHRHGWKARYVPRSVVYHVRFGTMNKDRELHKRLRDQSILNLINTIKRHATIKQRILVTLIWAKEGLRQRINVLLYKEEIGHDYFERVKLLWRKKNG